MSNTTDSTSNKNKATNDKNYTLEELLELMARLREPEFGCPWDLAQDYKSIAPSTLEEAYEVVDAIENGDKQELREELGDLLFQVVFYSQLGKEENSFDFGDIITSITAKLLRRHPHVFPEGTLSSRIDLEDKNIDRSSSAIKKTWEHIKKQERASKGNTGLLDDIPQSLPAINRAEKMQKRAASVGFDWDNVDGVYNKINEEIEELKNANSNENIEEELGDLLFTIVNLSRHLKVDPETALRKANTKFKQRFEKLESIAEENGELINEQPAETLDQWWEKSK
jgi:ATP diphosphatase